MSHLTAILKDLSRHSVSTIYASRSNEASHAEQQEKTLIFAPQLRGDKRRLISSGGHPKRIKSGCHFELMSRSRCPPPVGGNDQLTESDGETKHSLSNAPSLGVNNLLQIVNSLQKEPSQTEKSIARAAPRGKQHRFRPAPPKIRSSAAVSVTNQDPVSSDQTVQQAINLQKVLSTLGATQSETTTAKPEVDSRVIKAPPPLEGTKCATSAELSAKLPLVSKIHDRGCECSVRQSYSGCKLCSFQQHKESISESDRTDVTSKQSGSSGEPRTRSKVLNENRHKNEKQIDRGNSVRSSSRDLATSKGTVQASRVVSVEARGGSSGGKMKGQRKGTTNRKDAASQAKVDRQGGEHSVGGATLNGTPLGVRVDGRITRQSGETVTETDPPNANLSSGEWTDNEVLSLRNAVAHSKTVPGRDDYWETIADSLEGRSADECAKMFAVIQELSLGKTDKPTKTSGTKAPLDTSTYKLPKGHTRKWRIATLLHQTAFEKNTDSLFDQWPLYCEEKRQAANRSKTVVDSKPSFNASSGTEESDVTNRDKNYRSPAACSNSPEPDEGAKETSSSLNTNPPAPTGTKTATPQKPDASISIVLSPQTSSSEENVFGLMTPGHRDMLSNFHTGLTPRNSLGGYVSDDLHIDEDSSQKSNTQDSDAHSSQPHENYLRFNEDVIAGLEGPRNFLQDRFLKQHQRKLQNVAKQNKQRIQGPKKLPPLAGQPKNDSFFETKSLLDELSGRLGESNSSTSLSAYKEHLVWQLHNGTREEQLDAQEELDGMESDGSDD